jgi:hypothetical protein
MRPPAKASHLVKRLLIDAPHPLTTHQIFEQLTSTHPHLFPSKQQLKTKVLRDLRIRKAAFVRAEWNVDDRGAKVGKPLFRWSINNKHGGLWKLDQVDLNAS